jgi:TonB family protein
VPVARAAKTSKVAPLDALMAGSRVLNVNTELAVDASARARRTRVTRLDRAIATLPEPRLANPTVIKPDLEMAAIDAEITPDDSVERVPADSTSSTRAEAPEPIYGPMPEYPVRARLEGIQGSVVATLRVGPDGRATGLRVTEATPVGVFEGAVRRSLMRWRYNVAEATSSSSQMAVTYRLNFSLEGVSSAIASVCATATASRTCEPQ